jgi:hypothetical protein
MVNNRLAVTIEAKFIMEAERFKLDNDAKRTLKVGTIIWTWEGLLEKQLSEAMSPYWRPGLRTTAAASSAFDVTVPRSFRGQRAT